MNELWIQKAKAIKANSEQVYDGHGNYLDSAKLTIEEIAAFIEEYVRFEYMSEMKELDESKSSQGLV